MSDESRHICATFSHYCVEYHLKKMGVQGLKTFMQDRRYLRKVSIAEEIENWKRFEFTSFNIK